MPCCRRTSHGFGGAKQSASFRWAREVLSSESVLGHFDITKRQVLICDASSVGVGAVLAQVEPDGTERPLGFVSRGLSASERKYSQIEREALFITFGVSIPARQCFHAGHRSQAAGDAVR